MRIVQLPVNIRCYEGTDREAVISLWNAVFPGSTGHNDPERAIERKCAHEDGLFFVAEDQKQLQRVTLTCGRVEGKEAVEIALPRAGTGHDNSQTALVGTVMAGYDGHRGWIYSLAVSPSFQRKRLGTALIRHAESALGKLGCPKLNLQVRSDNESVVAFYESLGYAVEDRVSMGKRIGD